MIKEKLSVIIPVYNESKNIIPLYKELKEELSKNFEDFEIIYINDGSQDNSLQELLSLKDVVILDLNKNYGQSIAFDCGFKHGTGYYFVTLDGDGQNDPKDIKRLYDELINKNLEVVSGFRKNRKDKKGILLLSKLGRYLRQRIIQDTVRDTGCSLRIYKRVTINSLDLYGEMHRYILAILR